MTSPTRYPVALFDLDGTLVDTVGDIADALNWALAEAGLPPVSEPEVRGMVGSGARQLCLRAAGPGAGEAAVDELVRAFRARYGAHVCERTRPFSGVPELLARASARMAVATNKPGPMARDIVAALGLARHFFAVLGEGDAPLKPDPAMVHALLARAGAAPGEALLIGDSLVDLAAARAAGVACCLVSWGYADVAALRAAAPDHFVERAADLAELV